MKKFLVLILALVMALSLVACGGEVVEEEPAAVVEEEVVEEVVEEEPVEEVVEEEPAASVGIVDASGAEVTEEQIIALANAYNEVAPVYNEIYTTAEANGWLEDELTFTELNAVGTTIGFIGAGLTEDLTMLDGSNFEELTNTVLQLGAALEEVAVRVSVPYEG